MSQPPRANSRQHKKQLPKLERPIKRLWVLQAALPVMVQLQQLEEILRLWRLQWNSMMRWKSSSKSSRRRERNSTTWTNKDPSTRLRKNNRWLKKKTPLTRPKPRDPEVIWQDKRSNTTVWNRASKIPSTRSRLHTVRQKQRMMHLSPMIR